MGGHSLQTVGNALGIAVVAAAQVQQLQVGQIRQLIRYRAGQPVAGQVQRLQPGEQPQLRRYAAAQIVIGELQALQLREYAQRAGHAAETGRDGLPQTVAVQRQPGDAAVPVGVHAVPIVQGRSGEPVGAVAPAGAAGGKVEGGEGDAVADLLPHHLALHWRHGLSVATDPACHGD